MPKAGHQFERIDRCARRRRPHRVDHLRLRQDRHIHLQLARIADWRFRLGGRLDTLAYDAALQLTALRDEQARDAFYYDVDGRIASITEDAGSPSPSPATEQEKSFR